MKKVICVDYSGVYEIPRYYAERLRDWPAEWGDQLDIPGRYLPNPHVYARVQKWREAGVVVSILTGGNSVDSAQFWPEPAQPHNAFDSVHYGNKLDPVTYERLRRHYSRANENIRMGLVDDSFTNIACAVRAGWDGYCYDRSLLHMRQDDMPTECFGRVSMQDTIAI